MDYTGLKCPACNTVIEADDDVVVCPECGTPHHRECYEDDGHCYFQDKHSEGFDFNEYIKNKANENNDNNSEKENSSTDVVICPRCQTANPKNNFYCSKCQAPLTGSQNPFTNNQNPAGNTSTPFGMPVINIDPMAGLDPNEEIDDGVTAGEVAKVVQNNTPYFLNIFKNIRDENKSKFSFCGMIFSGGYMLYRKMYKLGTIYTIIMGLLIVAGILVQTLPMFGWSQICNELIGNIKGSSSFAFYQLLVQEAFKLPSEKAFIFFLPVIFSVLEWIVMIISGAIVNKAYFKHTIKTAKKIKNKTTDETQKNKQLKEKGGVNAKVALCLFVCYLIISYLPYYLPYIL